MTRLLSLLAVCLGLFLLATRDGHAVGVLEDYLELGEDYPFDAHSSPAAYGSRTRACTWVGEGEDVHCWDFPSVRSGTWDECYYNEWGRVRAQAWLNSLLDRRIAVRVECVLELDA